MDTQDQIALWDASNDASETVYSVTNDASRCVKCGLCIAFCPCNVLEANEEGYPFAAHIDNCVGCTTCAGNCPQRALTVECEGDATYDPFADEPRAEPIDPELHRHYAELERTIMDKLDLRWRPVAVSLIDKDELLEVTPVSLRIRKKELDSRLRKRAAMK